MALSTPSVSSVFLKSFLDLSLIIGLNSTNWIICNDRLLDSILKKSNTHHTITVKTWVEQWAVRFCNSQNVHNHTSKSCYLIGCIVAWGHKRWNWPHVTLWTKANIYKVSQHAGCRHMMWQNSYHWHIFMSENTIMKCHYLVILYIIFIVTLHYMNLSEMTGNNKK